MMPKMMEGMNMAEIMLQMMSKMMGGEGGMPSMMMQMMRGMMGSKKRGEKGEPCAMPIMETQENFKP